jgi:DNA-binding NarL/FixJ family response regulator
VPAKIFLISPWERICFEKSMSKCSPNAFRTSSFGLFLSRKGDAAAKTPDLHLTEREANILDLLAEGYDNKKMGELLFLSEHTVRDYVSSLMTKLKEKNRTQVVACAFRLGLLH